MAASLSSKEGGSVSEALLKQLECPVCFEYCSAPIIQCVNGHNLCSPCRAKLKQCPTCRGKISLVRNRFAEEMAATLYPCPHLAKGCNQVIMLRAMPAHLRVCAHACAVKCYHTARSPDNPMCFVPCEWRGSAAQLFAHVKATHPAGWHRGLEASIAYKLRKQHMILVAAHEHLFWSLLKFDFTTLDMRGAVFAVSQVKPSRFKFQYQFSSGDITIFKRGAIGETGTSSEAYNSTIFQGKRMFDQFVKEDKMVICKVKIMKAH